MNDLFIRRVYSKAGISIFVELDFIKKTIAFVDRDGNPKEYMFAQRTAEYMHGWIMIFEAMKYAATEAKKEMDAINEKEQERLIAMYMELDKSLKKVKV